MILYGNHQSCLGTLRAGHKKPLSISLIAKAVNSVHTLEAIRQPCLITLPHSLFMTRGSRLLKAFVKPIDTVTANQFFRSCPLSCDD